MILDVADPRVALACAGALLVVAGAGLFRLGAVRRRSDEPTAVVGATVVAGAVVVAEGIVGVLLVAQLWQRVVATASLVMLVGFSTLIGSLLVRGRRPACACFGSSSSKPISWMTLARNAVFVAANVFALLGATS